MGDQAFNHSVVAELPDCSGNEFTRALILAISESTETVWVHSPSESGPTYDERIFAGRTFLLELLEMFLRQHCKTHA